MSPRFRFGKYKPVIAVDVVSTESVDCDYRAVDACAVFSLLFGVGSIVTILDWSLALVPVAGIVLGVLALRRIRQSPMEMVGASLAYFGIALSVVLWACGYARLAYVHYWQPPAGYVPTTFSALQPDPRDPQQRVSEEARMLDQRNVYLRGRMHPGRHQTGIREFFLLEDSGANPFVPPRKRATQIVRVVVKPPRKVDFVSYEVGVAGKLSVYETDAKNEMGGLVYKIEAEVVR
jgi:hypothetical protein